jgi:hypothetical protein
MASTKNEAIDALLAAGDVTQLAQLASASEASDKETAKAARRALHTLRTRGVKVPEAKRPAAAAVPLPLGDRPEAWTCIPDANGERLVVAIVPAPGGDFHVVTAHVSDERGLLQMSFGRGPRKHAREVRRSFEESGGFAADVAIERAAELIESAYQLTLARGASPPSEFAAARRVLPRVHVAPDEPHPAAAIPPAEGDAFGRDQQELLHHLPIVSRWVPSRAELNVLEGRLNAVVESRVLADGAQRQAAWQDAIDRSIVASFDAEGRKRWQRRLYDTAFVVAAGGHMEEARVLRAQGDRLGADDFDPLVDPFARGLVEKVTRGKEVPPPPPAAAAGSPGANDPAQLPGLIVPP